ncbi:MAG: hypothetical protein F6J92_06495 [Symploca sp. SIO1A3]|nr:hypothetical protein [Symploca sp. SIO1A3]
MPKTNKNKLGQTFHPLTEQAAREWYKLKFLNTPGYLLTIKSFFTKPDSDFVIPNVAKFCREWGISKSAFYRAINTLTSMGKLSWEATEGIVLKPHNKVTIFPQTKQCPMSGTVSHERDSDSHERDSDSHERDSDSHERDTPICNDHAHNRSITDLIQISPPPPTQESVCKENSSGQEEATEILSSSVVQKKEELNLTHQTLQKVKDSAAPIENENHTQYEHPASKQERWMKGDSKKPDWAIHRRGCKWIAKPEFIEWYAKSREKDIEFAANLLQKAENEDTTQLLWKEYQNSLQPSQPLTAPSYSIRKPPSPEEEKQRKLDSRLAQLNGIPEGKKRFIPKWLPSAIRNGELALSDIPQWIQKEMEF